MENDMLSSLLSDPEALQNAMKTVSDLLGGQPSAQTEPQSTYDPASEMMQKALPVIGAIAQSGQNAVKPENAHCSVRSSRSLPRRSPASSTVPSVWSAWLEWRARHSDR